MGSEVRQFEEALKKSIVIMLNKPSLEYFGILSYGLKKYVYDKESFFSTIHIPALAYTDGETITYLADSSIDDSQITFITSHELMHIISHHIDRIGNRDHILWNLATDHVVNRVLIKLSERYNYIKAPKGLFYVKEIDQKEPEITAEKLYDILKKEQDAHQPRYTITVIMGDGSGSGKGNPKDGDQQPGNGSNYVTIKVKDNKTGEEYTVSGDVTKDALKGIPSEELEKRCRELAEKATMIWKSGTINKGNMPGEIVEYLDDLFEVHIPWWEVLENVIMYYGQNQEEPSWIQRNIYFPHLKLPGYVDGPEVMTLVCSVDASGSIDTPDLKRFMGVVLGATRYYKNLVVLVHDHRISDIMTFQEHPSVNEVVEKVKNIKGRGGTSHKEVFDYIENATENQLVSSIIFLTDFESDVQHIYKNYRFFKEIPTIWVLNTLRSVRKVELTGCKTHTIAINPK